MAAQVADRFDLGPDARLEVEAARGEQGQVRRLVTARGVFALKEDERKRIARELHDELGPSLTAVIINLQLLAKQRNPELLARKVEETVDLVPRVLARAKQAKPPESFRRARLVAWASVAVTFLVIWSF